METSQTSQKKQLEVGDRVYWVSDPYSSDPDVSDFIMKIIVIERVTKTKAVSKNFEFKRCYVGNTIRLTGKNTLSTNYFEIETEELKEHLKKQQTIKKKS
jgi:hypothetical protein